METFFIDFDRRLSPAVCDLARFMSSSTTNLENIVSGGLRSKDILSGNIDEQNGDSIHINLIFVLDVLI
jgi:hypothetical protein